MSVSGRTKLLVLGLLAVQNSSQMLLMRYARTSGQYSAAIAVTIQELIKLVVSIVCLMRQSGHGVADVPHVLWSTTLGAGSEFWIMAVPAVVYVLQNNLLYWSTSLLDAATVSVLYQLKILTTAGAAVMILRQVITMRQWAALFVLFVGVAAVHISTTTAANGAASDPLMGLVLVVLACCLSAFAGIYFERVLKSGSKGSAALWTRNLQLAALGAVIGLGTAFWEGGDLVDGVQNLSWVAWAVVIDMSIGGLLVALVVQYADNVAKGFATSISIVLSTVVSIFFMGFQPTRLFFVGAVLVGGATFLYSTGAAVAPSKRKEDPKAQ